MLATWLAALLLNPFGVAAPQAAQATDYAFDIILFENLQAKRQYLADRVAHQFILETLNAHQQTRSTDSRGKPLYRHDDPRLHYRSLRSGTLDGTWKRLSQSAQYHVLARKTWRQRAPKNGGTIRIPVSSQPASINAYLTGNLYLTFSRYIHLDTDLSLHHGVQNSDISTAPTDYHRVSKVRLERKMRSNENHYIDHPLLGIVINIKRLPKQSGGESGN